MKNSNSQLQRGFTLVELLIVVIILSILAAIVVPQFASSTDDAKLSALDTNLANMRAAIDLYYQQHGAYPGEKIATGGTCPGTSSAPASGAAGTKEAFIAQLTHYTNASGEACTGTDTEFKYGPYLKKDALPENPITGDSTLAISAAGILGMSGAAAPGAGWKFDWKTGQFIADHVNYDNR